MFEEFMLRYGKIYETPAVKEKKFKAFKDNIKEIEKHNSRPNSRESAVSYLSDRYLKTATPMNCPNCVYGWCRRCRQSRHNLCEVLYRSRKESFQ